MVKVDTTLKTANDCKGGKPCGLACVSKSYKCRITDEQAAFLAKIFPDVAAGKEATPSSTELQKVMTKGISSAKTQSELDKVLRLASNRLPPDELTAVLDHVITLEDGTKIKIRDIANNPDFKDKYELPGMKRDTTVTNDQVDQIWSGMSAQQRNLLVPVGAGAPDRPGEDVPPSYIETDWNKNTELMRKSMLKALLEQIDQNGEIIDPWTGKPLKFPADLDHIIPLAKKGGHGGKSSPKHGGPLNTTINSENWVWIAPEINRNYKNNDDLADTVAAMVREEKLNISTNGKHYRDHLDEKKKEYQATGIKAIRAEARQKAIYAIKKYFDPTVTNANEWVDLPDPNQVEGMEKKEAEVVYKALRDSKIVVVGYTKEGKPTYGGLAPGNKKADKFYSGLDDKQYPKAVAELYREVHATQESAIAKVKIDRIVQQYLAKGQPIPVLKIPTNQAVVGILKTPDPSQLSTKQQHRVFDKFIATYPDPTTDKSLPDDIKVLYTKALSKPLSGKEKSASPWSYARANAKIPNMANLEPNEQAKLYKYLQDTMGTT